jgi:transcriptional antiterminator NusG
MSEENKKRWYIVQAFSGFEKKVKQAIEDRVRLEGVEDLFGDILVPTEDVTEMRGGKKRKTERKLFPGYVLVNMVMTDETWHLIKNLPRVAGFIGGTKDHPAPITDQEAQTILQQIETGAEKPKPKVLFEAGEVIRVNDGPFADFNGVVEEVNYEKNRLRVAVMIFGRSTPVELEFSQVEKT